MPLARRAAAMDADQRELRRLTSMLSLPRKETDMHKARWFATLGLAALLTGAIANSSPAAPVLTNTAAVKSALGDDVEQVRWGWGWGVGAVIGGLALGAALATPYYGYGYGYGYPYAYGYPYGYGYGSYYPYYRPYWGVRSYYGGYGGYWRRGYWGRRWW